MRELKFVIGANFGDEGKGLMTDYFCHQARSNGCRTLVIMPNGGSQRGHTVCLTDGIRHVFHHFSSGTFAGADSFFTRDFILNPMTFNKERIELNTACPKMFASSYCRVATPYDMMYNQLVERLRGKNKHGSCGAGIYQTIDRYKNCPYYSVAAHYGEVVNLMHRNKFIDHLEAVKYYYKKKAKEELDIDIGKEIEEWDSVTLMYHYFDDFTVMANIIHPLYDMSYSEGDLVQDYDTVVVELGQGMMLDKDNQEYYPNLTPSKTTFAGNIDNILNFLDIPSTYDVEVCYVTRTYLTRHGNGRLDGECSKEELSSKIEDATNIHNEHQGSLRFAPLDVKELILDRIKPDFESTEGIDAGLSVAVTHNDQLPMSEIDLKMLRHYSDRVYVSDGATREDVKIFEKGGV